MDRREFLKTALAAPLSAGFNVRGERSSKPNLLFLWADQQRPDTMRVYGNTRIHTPSFNRLAGESVVFEHPYVTQPVCTPSRSCVLTGLWPHTTGCTTNNIPLPKTTSAFPEILADDSYRTGYFGKWHLGDELSPQHGFEEWRSIEDLYSPDSAQRSSYDQFLRGHGQKPDLPDGRFSRQFASRLPLELGKPRFLERETIDFLRRHRSEPFVLYVNFLEPHPPYDGPFNDEYEPAEMELPPNFGIPPGEDEPLAYRVKSLSDRQLPRQAAGLDLRTEAGWRRLIANYWGNVTHIDGAIGGILKALEELGLADSTIVVHTADHGELLGAHAMYQKEVMYEESVKVPWLMRVPRLGRKQRVVKGRFSHIDLVPTLLELMDQPIPDRLPGRSLLPAIRKGRHREPVFIEWHPGAEARDEIPFPGATAEEVRKAKPARTRAVVTHDGWKLCLSDADRHQLFNLNQDPWELENLFYEGSHSDAIRRLTREIHNWQRRATDVVVVDPGKF